MKNIKILLLIWITVNLSCKEVKNEAITESEESPTAIQIQGHRGERGHWPENSLPGFKSAVEKGADVIELDVVISKDKKVVVSHEAYMSSQYMLTPEGDSISRNDERKYNLYEMNYDSIKKFDAGSRGNKRFPEQNKIKTYKPLLSEVIDSIESFIQNNDLKAVGYNIELKSVTEEYDIYQPDPSEFVDLVMQVLGENSIRGKINIQSFDVNVLQAMNTGHPDVKLAYLVSEEGIAKNLAKLGFNPEIYSPHYGLVKSKQFVDSIKEQKMELIPWTVNEKEDIKKMLDLKVDGIITDYPARVIELKGN